MASEFMEDACSFPMHKMLLASSYMSRLPDLDLKIEDFGDCPTINKHFRFAMARFKTPTLETVEQSGVGALWVDMSETSTRPQDFTDSFFMRSQGIGADVWPMGLGSYLKPPLGAARGPVPREPTMIGCYMGPLRVDGCAPCCMAASLTALEDAPGLDRHGADSGAMMWSCLGIRWAACFPLLGACRADHRDVVNCCEAQCCGGYLGCCGDPLACCCRTGDDEFLGHQPVEQRCLSCNLCCEETLWMRCWSRRCHDLWNVCFGVCCPTNEKDQDGLRGDFSDMREDYCFGCHCLSARCACLPMCCNAFGAERPTSPDVRVIQEDRRRRASAIAEAKMQATAATV